MRKSTIIFISIIFLCSARPAPALAFWMWTPETNKWENPKYAVKGTPVEQLKAGTDLLEEKEYEAALNEFKKLLKHYPKAAEAPQAQFFIAECLESLGQDYKAFKEYQVVIEKYPFSDLAPSIVERQYTIAERMLKSPGKNKFVTTLTGGEYEVIDVLRTVIKNAPYGPYAAAAQYKIGMYLSEKKMYQEARDEFEKVVNDYPDSEWSKAAQYEIALADASRSAPAPYEQKVAKGAVKQFKDFIKAYPDAQLSEKARKQISELSDKGAENYFLIGQFYLKNKKYESANIYFNAIIDEYPSSTWAPKALEQIRILDVKAQ